MVIEESGNESEETAAPKRRRAPKGDMRRKALLDAATVVFARDGYSSASMREVALLAGITTVGLLHHFPNKEALLAALLERRDQRVTSRFQDLVTEPTLDGFLKFLKLSMSFSIENADECQAALLMNTESLSKSHPACTWHRERFQLTHEHARGHLHALIEAGEVRADINVKALAQEIFSVMDGLQIQWLRSPQDVDVMAVFDIYVQRLGRDIKAHP
ncbi:MULTISPECIES: TetR/AcrR family transcriptional regulator [Pseudomonas syringae group genomosp. 2]|uniref:TetR family transcriptional regulator n=1 Tax=Pseudomonas amygdali pv. ulmi TaxID=251720 RepID=A0A0Q0E2T3_PSEA0|nr:MULTISPECIES: TetR/AcrR family transcriptional regulator [Pseudomonas syringae group genomosp. 2]EGH01421.1 TetR family transcriptional regulator [Pseudomonas amygdali pv. aesculi str. 0893_23]KPZ08054.1 TetR family transcriptional regulator [Pseudomonas amygdali pv. ulmi]KWS11436.1 TetR family transcriptional regulator [Pseudomonas amygdali pv. ulmi]KWT09807.1 TetR family transcriptional regulator [Pseudomonas amygdali pv. aesculi]KWT14781.1 TetR family transcriptional regulator [Pseudomon